MRIFYLFTWISLVLFSISAITREMPEPKIDERVAPYLFCNVFLADGCFGIAAGDNLKIQVIKDFVLYDLTFSSGGTARLYSGFNPSIKQEDSIFEKCTWIQGFSECKIRGLNDGKTEFFARRTAESTAIHLIIDATVSSAIINSFLRNIRSCRSSVKIIRCDAE